MSAAIASGTWKPVLAWSAVAHVAAIPATTIAHPIPATTRTLAVRRGSRRMITVAAMAAKMVSTCRACSVLPSRVCSVDTSRAGFSSRPRPTFCEYGPCSSKAASVEPISPVQLAMTRPGTPRRRAPEGQQAMRKATAPASSV
jgi:hypothetical protein